MVDDEQQSRYICVNKDRIVKEIHLIERGNSIKIYVFYGFHIDQFNAVKVKCGG